VRQNNVVFAAMRHPSELLKYSGKVLSVVQRQVFETHHAPLNKFGTEREGPGLDHVPDFSVSNLEAPARLELASDPTSNRLLFPVELRGL